MSTASCIGAINAANEIAVARFLEGRIAFTSIPRIIDETMSAHRVADVPTLEEVRKVDRWARAHADEIARGVKLGL
jgi:1-deoxy-D-xylulose-5-phosphate reductoisomerase